MKQKVILNSFQDLLDRFRNKFGMTIVAVFLKISPIVKFSIKEQSMIPTINPGDLVLAEKITYLFRKPKKGEVVVFRHDGKYLVKRISQVKGDEFFALGDNSTKSTDSKDFGWINKKNIIANVFYIPKFK